MRKWPAERQGAGKQGSALRAGGPGQGLRDGALGEGQVIQEHIQATVLLVEELLHPPADTGLLKRRQEEGPGAPFPQGCSGAQAGPTPEGQAERG